MDWLPVQGAYRLGAPVYDFHVDTLDKRLFPSVGTLGHLAINHSSTGLGADFDYTFASFNVQQVYTNGANVWTLSLRGGSNLGTEVPVYDQFRLGGLFNLSGFRQNELIGREYGLAGVLYRRRIGWLDKTMGTAPWAGVSIEYGNMFSRADGTPAGGGLFLTAVSDLDLEVKERSIHSVIGPSGAGKTTFFNCATGFYRHEEGTILFQGGRPWMACRRTESHAWASPEPTRTSACSKI